MTVISPSLAGMTTSVTISDRSRRSGDTSSNLKLSAMTRHFSIVFTKAAAPETKRPGAAGLAASNGSSQLLCLFDRFFDRADHVEGGFRKMVVFAVHQALEALDRVFERNELARRAGEDFGNEERLRQEAFDLACAGDRDLVFFRQLVHPEDGDDVLKRLVALQGRLDLAGDFVVLFADDQRVEHARG